MLSVWRRQRLKQAARRGLIINIALNTYRLKRHDDTSLIKSSVCFARRTYFRRGGLRKQNAFHGAHGRHGGGAAAKEGSQCGENRRSYRRRLVSEKRGMHAKHSWRARTRRRAAIACVSALLTWRMAAGAQKQHGRNVVWAAADNGKPSYRGMDVAWRRRTARIALVARSKTSARRARRTSALRA
jgi:hypothetical protein